MNRRELRLYKSGGTWYKSVIVLLHESDFRSDNDSHNRIENLWDFLYAFSTHRLFNIAQIFV